MYWLGENDYINISISSFPDNIQYITKTHIDDEVYYLETSSPNHLVLLDGCTSVHDSSRLLENTFNKLISEEKITVCKFRVSECQNSTFLTRVS